MRLWIASCLTACITLLAGGTARAFDVASLSKWKAMTARRIPTSASVILDTDQTAETVVNTPVTRKFKKSLPSKEELFLQWINSDSLKEIPHPGIPLKVSGSIPSYVKGIYIKNGPGALSTPDQSQRYTHAFDGLAKLQKFDICGNSVQFTTRFVDSRLKRLMLEENKIPAHISLGPVEPKFPWWDVMLNTMHDVLLNTVRFDNACVNIEELSSSGTYCAVTDSAVRQEIDIQTLTTVRRMPDDKIAGIHSVAQFSTAHGKVAQRDGLSYNYFLETGLENYAHIVRTNRDLTRTSIGKIKVDAKFSYVHDISVTDNYAIVAFCPLVIDMAKAMSEACLLPFFEYKLHQTTKICVFDLNGVQPVQTFESPAFWCYHHVNAYEETVVQDDGDDGDRNVTRLVLDLLAYDTPDITDGLYTDNMKTEQARLQQQREGTIWRFHLPLDGDDSSTTTNSNDHPRMVQPVTKVVRDKDTGLPWSMELCTVAPNRMGKPYRYAYGVTGLHKGVPGRMDWAICKQDMSPPPTSTVVARHGVWYEEFMYPGEVAFVANPYGTREDDGVLISTVYDSRRRENCLLVLHARSMKELARAYTGVGL
jgi:beta,beta-carotene 9',10'-dioxygenase